MKLQITKAKISDLENYLPIKRQSLIEYSLLANKNLFFNEKKITLEYKELIKNKNCLFHLAKINLNIVGFSISTLIKNDYQKCIYIDDLYVIQEFRNQGIASQILTKLEVLAKKAKLEKLRLGVRIENKKAISLYNKKGFKIKHYEMELDINNSN